LPPCDPQVRRRTLLATLGGQRLTQRGYGTLVATYRFALFKGEHPMSELIDKAKGKIKEVVGHLTGNKELERQGKRDEVAGAVEGAIADVKHVVKDAGHAIKDAVK
jgi:uncharacterized protein YjbJ (UPF0337 family)